MNSNLRKITLGLLMATVATQPLQGMNWLTQSWKTVLGITAGTTPVTSLGCPHWIVGPDHLVFREAAQKRSIEEVKKMAGTGANVKVGRFDGTALYVQGMNWFKQHWKAALSITAGTAAVAYLGYRYWTASGAVDNNPVITQDSPPEKDDHDPLIAAIRSGDVGKVQAIIMIARVDLNKADKDGRTALALAAGKGDARVVEILLKAGADVNQVDSTCYVWGPIHAAMQAGHEEIVKILLTHKADPNKADSDGRTVLNIAVGKGSPKMVKLLLEHGAEVDTANKWGTTPLAKAEMEGRKEIVEILLKAKKTGF